MFYIVQCSQNGILTSESVIAAFTDIKIYLHPTSVVLSSIPISQGHLKVALLDVKEVIKQAVKYPYIDDTESG